MSRNISTPDSSWLAEPIYVAGHTGMIGSAVVDQLKRLGARHVVVKSHSACELTDAEQVNRLFAEVKPAYVVLAAGRVGGIVENNTYPADFITENLAIQMNVIKAAHNTGSKRLLMLGSSCMYPKECPQPMAETALFSGRPEPTSMAYAVAKMAGVEMCLAYNRQFGSHRFLPIIPNSTYGPGDNFNEQSGHVLSVLLRRFHQAVQEQAASVTLWGTGTPRREFVYVDDVARAVVSILAMPQDVVDRVQWPVNVGQGTDVSIRELAEIIAKVVGFKGALIWDTSKPDGAPRKLLNSDRMRALGWSAGVDLDQGIRLTYEWYLKKWLRVEAEAPVA